MISLGELSFYCYGLSHAQSETRLRKVYCSVINVDRFFRLAAHSNEIAV
jgi:hypothetical protein